MVQSTYKPLKQTWFPRYFNEFDDTRGGSYNRCFWPIILLEWHVGGPRWAGLTSMIDKKGDNILA